MTQLGIYGQITLCLQEFPIGELKGTPSSTVLYLTVYPFSRPNTDRV